MIQHDVNAALPPANYGDQYFHNQRPLVDGRYVLMDQDQTMRGWAPGPSVSLTHGPTEWVPVQRGTGAPPLDHGCSQNWQMSRTRSLDHGPMLGVVDMAYPAQVTPTGFGPYLERQHSLGTTVPHHATYPLVEPPLAPVSYGNSGEEPRDDISNFYSGQAYHPVLEQTNRPTASYDLGPEGTSFRPGHSDRHITAPRRSRKSKRRRREDYIERLEQQAFGAPQPSEDMDRMEFDDDSIQPNQDLPRGKPNNSTGADLVLEEGQERSMTDVVHLSHVSASLLPLTHGFTHLAGPPPQKDVRMSFYGIN